MEQSGSFLTTHLDILFIIISLLSVEDLVRVKLVCRSWFKLINDPTFLLAHCTRPSPITAFFTSNRNFPGIMGFKPFYEENKFPNCIMRLLENRFWVVSANHGLLCLRNENENMDSSTFLVGNPATSMWAVLNFDIPPSGFSYSGAALIFDPFVSIHFKLAFAMFMLDTNERNKHYIGFHIYSSETSSWTMSSSVYTIKHSLSVTHLSSENRGRCVCYPSNIGGGSVCWRDELHSLVGYDISTDTYWKTPLPPRISNKLHTWGFEGHNGDVYCVRLGSAEGRVWRLDGKNSWVLEGEAKNEGLLNSDPFAYDKVRGALLVGTRRNNELYAFHVSTSRLELIREGARLPWEDFDILDSRMQILWLLFVVENR